VNWNELETLWRDQPPRPAGPARSATDWTDTCRRRARRLFWRDVTEAGAGFAVAGFLALVSWLTGTFNAGTLGGIALMTALSGFFVAERARTRRQRPAPEASVRQHVEVEIAEVRRQIALLRHLVWWYLLPCGLAIALYLGGVWWELPEPARAGMAGFLRWYAVACVGLYAAIWWLNQRTVRHTFEPQLRELEALRAELDPEP
jgi:hypothetical protein